MTTYNFTTSLTNPPTRGHSIRWGAFIAGGLLLLLGDLASADDWPFARGGLDSTGVAASKLPSELEVLWTYRAEESSWEATPVVQGGIAYLGDVDGTVHAVRIADGTPVWTKTFEESGFVSPAAIAGELLYVGDLFGTLRALDIDDGTEKWSATLAAEVMAGPLVYEGELLVTTEGGTFTSFNATTGAQTWEYVIDAPLRCTPTVVDGKAMLAGCDGKLHIIDLKTGKAVGSVAIDGPTGSTPAARDNRIYFGTEQGTFYAIETGENPSIAWQFQDRRRKQGIRTTAAVNDTLAVFGSQGRAAFALELATGAPKWTFATRSRVESSPVIAGDVVVVATQRGKLHLVDLETGQSVWEDDFGGGFVASGVVVDGVLLMANTDGTLYSLGKKGAAAAPQKSEEPSPKASE